MRKERHLRPNFPVLRTFLACAAFAFSLTFHSTKLIAAEEESGVTCADPSATMLMQARPAVDNVQNLFTGIRQYLGIRYRFGGDSPAGFDCSGFVKFMFSKELNVDLPHSSREMATMGARVDRSELRPGDLVFFTNGKNRINHVGIFIGNGAFVHSSLSKGITRDTLDERYYNQRFATGVRILDTQDNHLPDDFNYLLDEQNDANASS